jgi:hypothetical protein
MWVSRSPVTDLVIAHTPTFSRVLDIPSPLSPSSFWVRVRVSVRRCCRFSGLYAFHSSGDVAVGMRRPTIAVMSCKAPASSTHALLQYVGHRVHHIRSKSTSENDTGGWGQTRSRTPSALLIVRLLTERYYRALSRWKYYALCSQSLSLCFVVSATASILHCLRDNNLSSYYFRNLERGVLLGNVRKHNCYLTPPVPNTTKTQN